MRLFAFALLAAFVSAPAGAQEGVRALLFECLYQGIDDPVEDDSVLQRRLAILGDFQPESDVTQSPILGVFDPHNLLDGGSLTTFALHGDNEEPDSFNWFFRPDENAENKVQMIVAPYGDTEKAVQENNYVGSLGIEGDAQPRWIGVCRILGGEASVSYFQQLQAGEDA